eukprot:272471-Prorocentrum_minimum.AAC.1
MLKRSENTFICVRLVHRENIPMRTDTVGSDPRATPPTEEPMRLASDWSTVRIYPCGLCLIGPP